MKRGKMLQYKIKTLQKGTSIIILKIYDFKFLYVMIPI